MDFSSGNSGNKLTETVMKIGNECQQEGAYCQLLGERIAPRVYAIIPNGYVMEKLLPINRYPQLLVHMYRALKREVWSRPALPSSTEIDWRDRLSMFGIQIPDYVTPTEYCMVHGDPTASNALLRDAHPLELIIADPRPPRDFIPQCKETDIGRLLQSKLGWEVVAYGARPVDFYEPEMDLDTRRKAVFWCGAAAARIEYLELSRDERPHILEWCKNVRSICGV